MAKIQFKAGDEYALKLSRLEIGSGVIANRAIYAAAGIVADAIREELDRLPTVTEFHNVQAHRVRGKSGLTIRQKKGLKKALGITPLGMDKKGFHNRKIGFDGYNYVVTRTYPKGQPNQMIARSVESGSSCMEKMPFVRPAVNKTKRKAVEKMRQVIDEELGKIMS